MPMQNYEKKNEAIRKQFAELKKKQPKRLKRRLNLSWSNWGFGLEPLAVSAVLLDQLVGQTARYVRESEEFVRVES